MNRKHLSILSAIVMVAIIVGLFTFFGSAREPKYQDHTLTEWLNQALNAMESPDAAPEHPERNPTWLKCQLALARIGTNAVPYLLRDLLAPKSILLTEVSRLARKPVLKKALGSGLDEKLSRLEYTTIHHRDARRVRAALGFSLLGTNACSVYPSLIELTKDTDEDTRLWGFIAFAATRPPKDEFLPVAIRLLNDPGDMIPEAAASEIIELYPDAAKTNGVYDKFPDLRPDNTNQPVLIN